ncbi:YceI family protein [Rhabdothermincola sediminis]|uniref:YceI family protein n=1 Tax=Rhabdothermincola sediminis TaxID=2751370 RepID=UPI001AA08D10|nr:YceI family protein [Rhabdothermincola sediminis]
MLVGGEGMPERSPGHVEGEPIGRAGGRSAARRLFSFVVVLAGVAAIAVVGTWWWLRASTPSVEVSMAVPDAPRLIATRPGQTVYRIDATRSSVTYEVEEILAGKSNTARGSTSGVAGDILVDRADPSASQLGEVVINVEQLTSDQSLRDDRIRHDFLESSEYPLAHLRASRIDGLPARISEGARYPLRIEADLEVKGVSKPIVLDAEAGIEGDDVVVNARTTVQLADWGIGPISLGPLARTGRDATLIIDVRAIDEAKGLPYQPGSGANGRFAELVMGSDPSFAATVQPILERNCATCHNPGQAGESAWRLDTAADVAKHADSIDKVVESRYMPPWPASPVGVPLMHERRLSDAEIGVIARWARAGGPLDVDPSTPIRPPADDLEQTFSIRHDRVLAPPEPYQGSTGLTNDYRCFAYDPQVQERTWVTGFEFLPDQLPVVHHALVFKVSASLRSQVEALDTADAGAGWHCFFGTAGPGGEQSPTGRTRGSELIAGWVPGQRPNRLPEGSGIKLAPGDFFVVQVHYHFAHEAPPDRSQLALEMQAGGVLDEIVTNTYLAPAEIPCRSGEKAPLCDRNAAIDELTRQFGPAASAIPDGLIMLCRRSLAELAVLDADGVARSGCDHRVVTPGEIVGVLGHEHQIGRTFRMTLNPGTPDEKVLLDIPSWDFNWQLVYRPRDRIDLKPTDVVRVECSWDRDLITSPVPRYVTWAEGTEDEMCYSTISVRVRRGG